jgi:hypothetical protein
MSLEVWSWRDAVRKSQLAPLTKLVLFNLSFHMTEAGEKCFPSISLQARYTGLGERSVYTHLAAAEKAGFISKTKRGFQGKQWAQNEYTATFPSGFVLPSRGASNAALAPVDNSGSRGAPDAGRGAPRAGQGVHHVQTNSSRERSLTPQEREGFESRREKARSTPQIFSIEKLLSDDGRDAARAKAPGWDLHFLMRIYDASVNTGNLQPPNSPDKAFAGWCKAYTKGKRP